MALYTPPTNCLNSRTCPQTNYLFRSNPPDQDPPPMGHYGPKTCNDKNKPTSKPHGSRFKFLLPRRVLNYVKADVVVCKQAYVDCPPQPVKSSRASFQSNVLAGWPLTTTGSATLSGCRSPAPHLPLSIGLGFEHQKVVVILFPYLTLQGIGVLRAPYKKNSWNLLRVGGSTVGRE